MNELSVRALLSNAISSTQWNKYTPFLKSVWIEEHLETQSGEESSSSGRFNPVGRLHQYTAEDDPQG